MATIDQIKKHYDKLTARERFALVVAAAGREDKAERTALIDSAPEVTFTFPHIKGLAEGFRDLTSYHLAQQLGTAGTFFMLTGFDYEPGKNYEMTNTITGETFTPDDAIELIARRFMEGQEAYKTVCAEYGVDPETMTAGRPSYPELLAMCELVIRVAYDDGPPELAGLEATKATYRELIETERAEWAEGKAR